MRGASKGLEIPYGERSSMSRMLLASLAISAAVFVQVHPAGAQATTWTLQEQAIVLPPALWVGGDISVADPKTSAFRGSLFLSAGGIQVRQTDSDAPITGGLALWCASGPETGCVWLDVDLTIEMEPVLSDAEAAAGSLNGTVGDMEVLIRFEADEAWQGWTSTSFWTSSSGRVLSVEQSAFGRGRRVTAIEGTIGEFAVRDSYPNQIILETGSVETTMESTEAHN